MDVSKIKVIKNLRYWFDNPQSMRDMTVYRYPLPQPPAATSFRYLLVRFVTDLRSATSDANTIAARPLVSMGGPMWALTTKTQSPEFNALVYTAPMVIVQDGVTLDDNGRVINGGFSLTRTDLAQLERDVILGACRAACLDVTTIAREEISLATLRSRGWQAYQQWPSPAVDSLYVYLAPLGILLTFIEQKVGQMKQRAVANTISEAATSPGLEPHLLVRPAADMIQRLLLYPLPSQKEKHFEAGHIARGRYYFEESTGDLKITHVSVTQSNRLYSEFLLFGIRLVVAALTYADALQSEDKRVRYSGKLSIPGDCVWYADCMAPRDVFVTLTDEEDLNVATQIHQQRQLIPVSWPPLELMSSWDSGSMDIAEAHDAERLYDAIAGKRVARRLFTYRFDGLDLTRFTTLTEEDFIQRVKSDDTLATWVLRVLSSSDGARRFPELHALTRNETRLARFNLEFRERASWLGQIAPLWDHLIVKLHQTPDNVLIEAMTTILCGAANADIGVNIFWFHPRRPGNFYDAAIKSGFLSTEYGEHVLPVLDRLCFIRAVDMPLVERQPDAVIEYIIFLWDMYECLRRAALTYGLLSTLSEVVYMSMERWVKASLETGMVDAFSRFSFEALYPPPAREESNRSVLKRLLNNWHTAWRPVKNGNVKELTYLLKV